MSEHPIILPDLEIHITVIAKVPGSEWDPSDWDHDTDAYIADMKKTALDGIRHTDLDLVVADIEKIVRSDQP